MPTAAAGTPPPSRTPTTASLDLATPLTAWWNVREMLRAGPPLQRDALRAWQSRLADARDGVRHAYSITQVSTAKDAAHAERCIESRLCRRASAVPVLLRLFDHAPARARLLHFGAQSQCCTCGHIGESGGTPEVRVRVADDALRQAHGDAFAAFVAECGGRSAMAPLGGGSDTCSHPRRRRRPTYSASAGTPADVLLLELDDSDAPERNFALHPEETRHMPLLQESYRLVGVLLYSHNYHYIADVLDPDGHGWVRYDANSNGAIGWHVGAPTGRVQHEHYSYYAILLAYVRVRDGPSDNAQS